MLDYPGVWQASYLDNFLEHPVDLSATYYHKTKISVNWHRFKKAYILLSHCRFPSLYGIWLQTESYFITITEYKRDPLIESTNISVHNKYSRLSLHFVIQYSTDTIIYLMYVLTLCLPKWYKLIIQTNIIQTNSQRPQRAVSVLSHPPTAGRLKRGQSEKYSLNVLYR